MAAPHCGICGSIDVVMDDSGLFVCQDCGARFTLKAMRNLMSEEVPQETAVENAENDPMDAQPEYKWGDADSDMLVKYCESNAYDLAAAIWNRLENREEPVHPWVVLQGKIAREVTNINDSSFKSGLIYRDYLEAYRKYPLDVRIRGVFDIYALQILQLAGNTIAAEQKRILGILTANGTNNTFDVDSYSKVISYQLSAVYSANIDFACYNAIIDIAGCIGRGYMPSNEEWNELSSHVKGMEAAEYSPLVRRIYERLCGIVSNGSLPQNYIESRIEDGALALLTSARQAWSNHNYDIANRAYEQLLENSDKTLSLEAKAAVFLFSQYRKAEFAYQGYIGKDYEKRMKEYSSEARNINCSDGIRICARFIILSTIYTEMAAHMTSCANAYLSADYTRAEHCRESAVKLIEPVKRSYSMFCESACDMLAEGAGGLEEEDYVYLKTVLNSFPDQAKDDEWHSAIEYAKRSYLAYLKTDQEIYDELNSIKMGYQKELTLISEQLASLKADYDKLGPFAIRKKDSLKKQIEPLQEREYALRQSLDAVESEYVEARWNGLASASDKA